MTVACIGCGRPAVNGSIYDVMETSKSYAEREVIPYIIRQICKISLIAMVFVVSLCVYMCVSVAIVRVGRTSVTNQKYKNYFFL